MRTPDPEKYFKLLNVTRKKAVIQFGIALEGIIYDELQAVKDMPIDDLAGLAKRRVAFRNDVLKFVESLYDEIVKGV
jgi:hypothetical protein